MTFITLIALIVVAALLWQRVEQLRQRVGELEQAAVWRDRAVEAVPAEGRPSTSSGRTEDRPVEEVLAPSGPTARVIHVPEEEVAPAPQLSVRPELVEGRPAAKETQQTQFHPDLTSPPTRRIGFEDIFGRKLPIWAGGITLAVCGLLIVKYSIEAGLLSPLVRVIGGLLFGAGLIVGAEAALRNDEQARDPRVRQALAGAGIATLYGSVLVATNVYGLVGPIAAFAGLALVTLLAALLAIRFGAPSAILGLVGGLAAPALVGAGEPNVPLLAFYLSLTVGGLTTLGRGQRWPWLGIAALTGGFGWGLW